MNLKLKTTILLLLAITASIIVSSCHNDEEIKEVHIKYDSDFQPISLGVRVINSDGQDLLDKNVEGNILDEKMTLTIDGLTTDVEMSRPKGEMYSRSLIPIWYGAYIWQIDSERFIYIGDFDGALNGKRSMELNLCGQKYDLSLTNDVTYDRKNQKHICVRCFYLDGQLIQSGGSPYGECTITFDR